MTTIADIPSVTINGIEYVRADAIPANTPNPDYTDSPVRILILQRGWVMVGYYVDDDNDRVTLKGARVIRKWGTTQGLGQLTTGPTSSTILDPAGTVTTHILGIVASLACDLDCWEEHLG